MKPILYHDFGWRECVRAEVGGVFRECIYLLIEHDMDEYVTAEYTGTVPRTREKRRRMNRHF